MMHYYMHDGPAAFRFELAGELDASDAARLEQDWRAAASVAGNRTLIIDVSYVTAIDEAARSLFRRWYAAGAEFAAKPGQSRELVESITGQPFKTELPHPPTYQTWMPLGFKSVIPVLALLTLFMPIEARAGEIANNSVDNSASTAFARFATRSAPLNVPDDTTVEIDASLPQMGKQGQVKVVRHRDSAGEAQYKVVQSTGDSTVREQVIARYLAIEQQAYARRDSSSAITPENYRFRYQASIAGGGNLFYVYAVKPRHRGDGAMTGQIWIDAPTGAIVHQEGRLKGGSVFVKKIEIVRDAGARVTSPYVRVTRVDIQMRWFGRAQLTIREQPAVGTLNAEGWQ
jgi:hypothetical protein